MADDSDQLVIDIGGDSSGFTSALSSAFSKASSVFGAIEQRGASTASTLSAAFAKVGFSPSLTLLNNGLRVAEANGSKLAGTLLKVQGSTKAIQGAAMEKAFQAELALIRKINEAGGLGNFASSLSGTAASALFIGAGAFAGYEALKLTIGEVTKAAAAAEAELAALVKIGDDSKATGVGTSFFQRFTEGSKKMGLEATDLKSILDTLKSAATVTLGSGDDKNPTSSAQDAIAAHIKAGNLKPGASAAFDAAGSQEDRLRAALALIDELQRKGAQLAAFDLAGKLFGSGFEEKLRGDDKLVANLQARLRDMADGKGVNVIPPEQIAAAREMQAQIEAMDQRIQDALRPFHNDLRQWQQDELSATLQLKEYWVEIVEVFGSLYKWCDKIGATISGWGAGGVFKELSAFLDKMGALKEGDGFHSFRDAQGNLTTLAKARAAGTEKTPDSTDRTLTITRPKGDTSRPLPEAHKAAHDKEDDPVGNYIGELKKTAAAEQAEAATLGMGNKAKQEAIDLAKAKAIADEKDKTVTAEQTREIIAQADAYAAAKDKIAAFAKAEEHAKERAQFFGNEFESSVEKMVTGSGKLSSIFGDLAKSLESAALKAALLGQGPLAGMFGTTAATGTGAASVGGIFGGLSKLLGFATGGEISGPGTGTSDSIFARLSHGEFVVNAKAAKGHLPLLHAINGGKLPKFATGGQVGATSAPSLGGASSALGTGGTISLKNETHVHANGGTPAQNDDLAKKVSAHIEGVMRQTVVSELRNQMRPGNLLSR